MPGDPAGKEPAGEAGRSCTSIQILGSGSSYRELRLVVKWLREAGVKEIDYSDDLVALAEENGSGWHEALDLCSAVVYGVEILYAGPRKARLMKPLQD